MKIKYTTIRLKKSIVKRLKQLKITEFETYDEIILRLLNLK